MRAKGARQVCDGYMMGLHERSVQLIIDCVEATGRSCMKTEMTPDELRPEARSPQAGTDGSPGRSAFLKWRIR